jgi:hypothetical protein
MVNTWGEFFLQDSSVVRQNEKGLKRGPIRMLEEVVIGTLMLVCAVAASLAFGVLVAYGMCQVMFRVFRVHQTAVARTRVAVASQVAIEG